MLMYPLSAQEADLVLCRCEDGVETALQYAKMWCRYAKDLLAWMEKRLSLGRCTSGRLNVGGFMSSQVRRTNANTTDTVERCLIAPTS